MCNRHECTCGKCSPSPGYGTDGLKKFDPTKPVQTSYKTKKEADESDASEYRIACVEIDWPE